MASPNVEILHVRDPDAPCELTVLVDGRPVVATIATVDPGAGHTRDDWDARTRQIAGGHGRHASWSDLFRQMIVEARTDAADSEHIS